MPSPQASLLPCDRLSVADAGSALLEAGLDGWPLVLVDLAAGTVRAIPRGGREIGVRAGAVGNEMHALLGEVAVLVDVPSARDIHADVRVIASATERLLFDKSVRYRQLAVVGVQASPVSADTGE